MTDNNVQDNELIEAYEVDKQRKNLREEELQAARDYVGVILEEAEGRSKELEGKKQEANALAQRLTVTESEIEQLKAQSQKANRQSKFLTFWMCFSLIELILIAGLCLALYSKLSSDDNNIGTSADKTEQVSGVVNNPVGQTIVEVPATERHVNDLAERVKYMSAESIAPFKATVETIDGLEYLAFTCDDIRVAYRNEYHPEDINNRKWIVVESGESRYMFAENYDLNLDAAELCPKYTVIGNRKLLAFLDYAGNIKTGIPEAIKLIDTDNFRMYTCKDLKTKIGNLMKVNVLSELSVLEDAPFVYELATTKATYKFAVSEVYYNEIQYNEYTVPEYESEFSINVSDNGISWNTMVKLGESLYMGRLDGNLVLSESGLNISGAKFGAFVPYNQEDKELGGYIRTATEVPERFVTIIGDNNERFYIAVNEDIPLCEYYWDNLNTDDPNNWIYYDADGNKASWRGIDVSKYQGEINWKRVADAGVEFAIIRMGFRGMNEGTLELDPYFLKNVKEAAENDIKVGVYFFSQAVNTQEAEEEAQYVLNAIKPYNITYPVIFDTERVTTYNARANDLSVAQRTDLCRVFCDTVAKAGYTPMIYANTKYMIMGLDLTRLTEYDKWYAVYSNSISFPYHFDMLQYSEKGTVDGISTNVDLNISFKDYSEIH